MPRRRARGHNSGVAIAFALGIGISITAVAAAAALQLIFRARCFALPRQRHPVVCKTPPPRRKKLQEQEWREALDDALRVTRWHTVLETIAQGGIDQHLRGEVWPFLLRVYDPQSTAEQRHAMHAELSSTYRKLVQRCQVLGQRTTPPCASLHQPSPQELETALEASLIRTGAGVAVAGAAPLPALPAHLVQFAEAQRIVVLDAVRTKLPALPGPTTPGDGRAANGGANGMGGVWCGRVGRETLATAGHLSASDKVQAARLINLLSAYAVHDPETGYCQGMSDLATPFLALFDDDTLAFWCFAQLMQTARFNFRHDEAGVRGQLASLMGLLQVVDPVLSHRLRQIGAGEGLFAYRMLVAMLRRETTVAQSMSLWEVVWAEGLLREPAAPADKPAAPPASEPPFFMFVVAAVVRSHRRAVLDEARDVDDVLRLFANVRVDVWGMLRVARGLQRTYRAKQAEA